MSALFPDFLRALVSSVMEILFMTTLLQPKYGKKINSLAIVGTAAINILIAVFCYISGSLTLLARLDLVMLTILCFALRPLFRDSFMQWLFSYLTMEIVIMCVVVLSFSLSRRLPYSIMWGWRKRRASRPISIWIFRTH